MRINLSESGKGQLLYKKAKKLIPGGTQLLSKRPEMFLPNFWPAYYSKALGAEIWDLDNHKYIDMSYCGIGSTVLGYADADVNNAVKDAIENASMTTLNTPEEVELAELLIQLHPWAEMVRLGRCGGESMAIAVRIARAYTKRDLIAFCGYHGWHDWYLSANLRDERVLDQHLLSGLEPAGVPRGLVGTMQPFRYNCIEDLHKIIKKNKNLAAIVMEPIRGQAPKEGFLEEVREIASKIGAVLIFDEVTSGFRINTGGIHLELNIVPDIAVFAKAIGNGFPMSAIVGKSDVMKSAQDSFISSTFWTERIGPVAALSTIQKFINKKVASHLVKIGSMVKETWRDCASKVGINIHVSGIDPLAHFEFKEIDGLIGKTLYTQLMLERGFLATNSFYSMYAHSDDHISSYRNATEEVYTIIQAAHLEGKLEKLLKGPVCHAGFSRLT